MASDTTPPTLDPAAWAALVGAERPGPTPCPRLREETTMPEHWHVIGRSKQMAKDCHNDPTCHGDISRDDFRKLVNPDPSPTHPTEPTAGEDEATAREFLRVAFGVLRRDGREVYAQKLARLLATTRQAAVAGERQACIAIVEAQFDPCPSGAGSTHNSTIAKIAAALRAGAGAEE